MYRLFIVAIVVGVVLLLTVAAPLAATDWPKEIRIGTAPGFHVVDIKSDNSNTATGRVIDTPGFQPFPITLTRKSENNFSGAGKSIITGLGFKLDIDYKITGSGLEAKGTIQNASRLLPKPISDASFTLTPQGAIKGAGEIDLGNVTIRCKYRTESFRLKVEGSSTLDPVKKETALASYIFKGDLVLRSNDQKVSVNAVGSVDRKGKLTGIVDTYRNYDEPVNAATGELKLDVAGVDVVFDLW